MADSENASGIPSVPAPLDPGFRPAVLLDRHYVSAAKASNKSERLIIGLEREDRLISRYETVVRSEPDAETLRYAERTVKFLLWARGGWRIHVGGPQFVGDHIRKRYSKSGERSFDVDLMSRVYERPFEVIATDAGSVPPEREKSIGLGGHLDGCRIGFDLGASDYKIAAVQNGEPVFTEEFPWNPKDESDPEYHYRHLTNGLKAAARHLPRVEAIGGSSAGVIVGNKIMVASLIRGVSADKLDRARNLFVRIHGEWGVPMEVANDGDVTALAGAMSLKANGLLGIAMGSSQAAGYLNPRGEMTGWLSELAFAPVDGNLEAPIDEWSGDRGVGVLYFSQQAVGRLLNAAGIETSSGVGLPERLNEVQKLMSAGDRRATRIYETIGVYLGYAIPHYAEFYDFKHVLTLGRVTTSDGGDVVLGKAREVMSKEFPELAARIELHVPDEKSRRIGQAVAAASLPALGHFH